MSVLEVLGKMGVAADGVLFCYSDFFVFKDRLVGCRCLPVVTLIVI